MYKSFGFSEDALSEEIHELTYETKNLFPREVTKLIDSEDIMLEHHHSL